MFASRAGHSPRRLLRTFPADITGASNRRTLAEVRVSITSMTGFARAQGHDEGCTWAWEIKSVNGKGLEVRCRFPQGFDHLERAARERVGQRFHRGNLQMTLSLERAEAEGRYRVNRDVLDQIISLLPDVRERLPEAEAPRLDGLLSLRGVIEMVKEEDSPAAREALEEKILAGLDEVLGQLAARRAEEGGRLAGVVGGHLNGIEALSQQAETLAAAQPDAIKARLSEQVAALLEASPALPEDRLAQEAALLMTRADVREELDRLQAHLEAARELIAEDGPAGRGLDFLCQEFIRETNTLCSKSTDVELTGVGLELKAVVAQLREQVQNVE